MAKARTLTVQRSVYLSEEMWRLLQQLADRRGNGVTPNDLIREALRHFIDNQAEVIGSKRHFQRDLQERVNHLELHLRGAIEHSTHLLVFYLHILIQLLSFALAHLLSASGKTPVQPAQLIQHAVIRARREADLLAQQVQAVREMPLNEADR